MHQFLGPPQALENMSCYPIQVPTSEMVSWTNIGREAYPPPYLLIPPNQGVSDESGTLLQEEPVSGVPVAGLHHVRPSNSKTPKSTVRLLPASGTSNKDRLNNIHSSTHVDTAFNIPLAPILHGASHLPPVESREKRGLQDRSHPYRKSRKKARTDPQFSCDDCGAKYAQKQGLNRHRLEKHNPSLCKYCGAEWGRPYVYRNHLEEHHPDVDRDMELGKQEGSRRRSAVFVRHRLQQVSPPTIGYGLGSFWDQGVHISSGETFNHQPTDMTYGSQFEFTQPIAASKSIPAGDHAQMAWIPRSGYASLPSNPLMAVITAVDGDYGSLNYIQHDYSQPFI